MKKFITFMCMAFVVASAAFSQDGEKTLIVKPMAVTNQNTVTDWGGANALDDSRYIMTKVDGEDNLYKCSIVLDAYFKTNKWKGGYGETYDPENPNEGWSNVHQYQVVYKDTYAEATDAVTGTNSTKAFVIEDGTTVTFYARLVQSDDYAKDQNKYDGKIRSACDAGYSVIQHWNGGSNDGAIIPANIGETTSYKEINIGSDTSNKQEFTINTTVRWEDFTSGERAQKHPVYSKGKHLVRLNYETLSYSIEKVLDEIVNPQIKARGGDLEDAINFTGSLGTFASSESYLLGGSIDGNVETANGTTINIGNVTAKMYYEIIPTGELSGTINHIDLTTASFGSVTTATFANPGESIAFTSLTDGTYTLKVWFETETFESILTEDNSQTGYVATFIIDNTATGIETPSVNASIFADNGIISTSFEGTADVQLYTVSGQLINQITATSNFNQAVSQGIYILKINNNAYKVAVK